MTDGIDIPTEDLERIKFLVHRIFTTALYTRYNWSSLSDRLYFAGLICSYADRLKSYLPKELVEEIKSSVDPLEGLSIQRDEEVEKAYQNWASSYDQAKNPLIAVEEPHVRQLMGDMTGRRVADIACGTGRYSRYAIQQGAAAVHGVDLSEAMLRVAQGYAAQVDNMLVAQGKIEAIPLPSNRYDLAVCGLALQHTPDLRAAIHEIARLLKTGGEMVISDFHPAMLMLAAETGIRGFVRSVEDYVSAVIEAGMHITAFREAKVGDLPAEFPRLNNNFVKLIAHVPFALVIKAQKQ